MFDAPIAEGANIFIWIACILIGIVAGASIGNIYFLKKKKDKKEESTHAE